MSSRRRFQREMLETLFRNGKLVSTVGLVGDTFGYKRNEEWEEQEIKKALAALDGLARSGRIKISGFQFSLEMGFYPLFNRVEGR